VQDVAIDVEWISEPLQEHIDDFRDHARIAAIRNNDDELIVAEPAYLGGPRKTIRDLDEALTDLDEQLIAGRMTQRFTSRSDLHAQATDRELLASRDLRDERAVCGIDVSRSRRSDIDSIEGKYADMSDVVGQLALELPEQRVIRRDIARIYGERLLQQKVPEIADVVVDLAGKNAGFVDGLLNRRRLTALPLALESAPDQGSERNHSGDRQGQKPRSNAPQHPSLPADRICLPFKRLLHPRGRPSCLAGHSSARVATAGKNPDFL
jgi:hypothetical protein